MQGYNNSFPCLCNSQPNQPLPYFKGIEHLMLRELWISRSSVVGDSSLPRMTVYHGIMGSRRFEGKHWRHFQGSVGLLRLVNWRWGQYIPSKYQDPIIPWRRVISQEKEIINLLCHSTESRNKPQSITFCVGWLVVALRLSKFRCVSKVHKISVKQSHILILNQDIFSLVSFSVNLKKISTACRNKKKAYLKAKIEEIETNNKIKNMRDL